MIGCPLTSSDEHRGNANMVRASLPSRPPLKLISSRRSPADILQELAMKSPQDFLALTTLAQGILQRLERAS